MVLLCMDVVISFSFSVVLLCMCILWCMCGAKVHHCHFSCQWSKVHHCHFSYWCYSHFKDHCGLLVPFCYVDKWYSHHSFICCTLLWSSYVVSLLFIVMIYFSWFSYKVFMLFIGVSHCILQRLKQIFALLNLLARLKKISTL